MEIHNSTVPYYLERKTKRFMYDFRDIGDIFTDFIIDFDIFSDYENETKNWPQFYLERDIKTHYENEYRLFKNEMNTRINIFYVD